MPNWVERFPKVDKAGVYFFFVFQNYVTEPLSDRSFKPSFQKDIHLFILTEMFLINPFTTSGHL